MGSTFRFDIERGLLFTKAEGPVTYEDVYAHLIAERKACGLSSPEIIDARRATPSLTSGEVRALVWLLHSLGENECYRTDSLRRRNPSRLWGDQNGRNVVREYVRDRTILDAGRL